MCEFTLRDAGRVCQVDLLGEIQYRQVIQGSTLSQDDCLEKKKRKKKLKQKH